MAETSWEKVGKWYAAAVGEEGHYYHKTLIIPSVLRLLALDKTAQPSLLDLACGQGILAKSLPAQVSYCGVDIAPTLISVAKKNDKSPKHHYYIGDVTQALPLQNKEFSHATLILAVQNIEFPDLAFRNAYKHLVSNGKFIIVMNHPCFRIPRQSSWQIDSPKKIQYRRIDRYYSPLKIPIQTHPSQGKTSTETWSFHYPLSQYTQWLQQEGFVVEVIEEWCSHKESTGKHAKMENRSRDEFPLFLTISAQKK